ncbi:hypothetical protein EV356DRAFT_517143 [Viridothelium virens]|uniref:Uncharacterized protein n=1 Tax=Viridothelium virens TaxID=1048519 RepID=A0A6A6H4L6_VIRVR|nr:hypothetical protein EV356DRAFT_517143 [Viridothelium virens]
MARTIDFTITSAVARVQGDTQRRRPLVERHEEIWAFLVPRLQEKQELCRSGWTPSDFIFQQAKHPMRVNLWSKLARSETPSYAHTLLHKAQNPKVRLSPLERLPPEMVAMILADSSLRRKDIVAFGLCSTSLWSHVLSHIEQQCRHKAAPWAGMELALIGTRLLGFPASFARDSLAWNSVGASNDINGQLSASDYAWSTLHLYTCPPATNCDVWLKVLRDQYEDLCVDAQFPLVFARSLTGAGLPWTLRNLDTLEYITCTCTVELKPSATKDEDCIYTRNAQDPGRDIRQGFVMQNGEVLGWLRVEDVIMSRICCSRAPLSINSSYPDHRKHVPKQGPWAGHRFDIVASGTNGFHDTNGWTDLTEQVVQEAETLWPKIRSKGAAGVSSPDL